MPRPTARPAAAPRLAPLTAEAWDAADRARLRGHVAAVDRYLSGLPDAPPLPGILGLLGHHPQLAANWLAFNGGLLDDPVLDPGDRELLILRVAWRTGCRYEWAQHARLALAAGLTAAQVAAAGGPRDAACWDDGQRDLLRAADQMLAAHRVDDATWQRLAARFDERALLEVLFVVGGYLCLALVLNSAGLEPDPGISGNGATLPGPEGQDGPDGQEG
jgi:4-carboxymuconolactone decarboxylase